MARQDVTVEIPVGNPGGTVKLLGKVVARNTLLGASSPIQNDFPWVVIAAGIAEVQPL